MRLILVAAAIFLASCSLGTEQPIDNVSADGAEAANRAMAREAPASQPIAAADPAGPTSSDVSPCLIQDGEELRITPVKAIGTEPFWGARVEGRCVTYSTPENQDGMRIWTRFDPAPDGGVWVGTYQGKPFKLITRLRPDCSDGMSDRIYPLEALLTVGGEERRGCAAPE